MPKTIEMAKTTKEKIKFKLEFMAMMLVVGRHEEATKAYEAALELIEAAEFVEETAHA